MKTVYKIKVHYYKQYKCWSVHYRGSCFRCKEVIFKVPSKTVLKPDKPTNPRGWIEAYGTVSVKNNVATIKR